uniref:Uncharacterized protein n=1 Tax=Fusarium oxysporum (strain Fo5176) TaxID=660025 RepID=A0A0D2Y011_FUSOF
MPLFRGFDSPSGIIDGRGPACKILKLGKWNRRFCPWLSIHGPSVEICP